METWIAGRRLGLDRCVLQVSYQMQRLINDTNVLLILKKADEYNIKTIKYTCFKYIADNYEKVALNPGFTSDFLTLYPFRKPSLLFS